MEHLQILLLHLEKYPLQSRKQADFLLFKTAVELILAKDHLTSLGLLKIVNLKASMNRGLSDILKESFPNHVPTLKLDIIPPMVFLSLMTFRFYQRCSKEKLNRNIVKAN